MYRVNTVQGRFCIEKQTQQGYVRIRAAGFFTSERAAYSYMHVLEILDNDE